MLKISAKKVLLTLALAIVLIPFTSLRGAQQEPKPNDPQAAQEQKPNDPGAAKQQSEAKSYTGKIEKAGEKFVLKAAKSSYDLDDQEKAQSFEGKDVKVTGTLDAATKTIHVTNIEPAT